MKDNPTIAAIRKAGMNISTSVGHDVKKLVARYRKTQRRQQVHIAPQTAVGRK